MITFPEGCFFRFSFGGGRHGSVSTNAVEEQRAVNCAENTLDGRDGHVFIDAHAEHARAVVHQLDVRAGLCIGTVRRGNSVSGNSETGQDGDNRPEVR